MQSRNNDSTAKSPSEAADTARFDRTGWGSDDMSAGARLMRYNVSDDQDGSASNDQTEVDGDNDNNNTTTTTTATTTNTSARQQATATTSTNDDNIFRGPLANIINDVFYDLATRYTNSQILDKINEFHPEANFHAHAVTWRLGNAIKHRSRTTGLTCPEVRQQFDAARAANGIFTTLGRHPGSQG